MMPVIDLREHLCRFRFFLITRGMALFLERNFRTSARWLEQQQFNYVRFTNGKAHFFRSVHLALLTPDMLEQLTMEL